MNKKILFAVFALLICFLVVSCDENQQLIINPTTPTPTIRGSVSIPDSADLSGNDFYIRVMEGEKAVYTGRVNADGSFSVPGLSEEASYSILLTTEEPGDITDSSRDISRATKTSGYGGWLSNVTASINEQAGVGSIKVKPLGTIKGVVKKDGAEDNYDTTVYIPGTSYLSMTDGEGNFSLFNVPQATYTLRYISNGYMAKMVENVVLYSESDTENPVTTVQRQTLIKNAGNLIGTISKIGSSDHSNITVMLSDGENVYTGSTGIDGSLMITGILPGTYSATISASGFITQTVESIKIEAAKNTTINPISLIANGGDIRGSVIMNDGGDKAGVLITAKSSDEKYSYTTSTDTEGKFTISNAYPGTYTLTLSKTNYAIITKTGVQSIAGQETNTGVFIFSSDYGTIEGTVNDSKGNPIENAIVKIGEITVFTGVDGKFSKTGIPVGSHQVTISQAGYSTQILTQQIAVESSKTVNIGTIKLSSLYGTINGTVTVDDGKSLNGIGITAVSSNGNYSYSTLTDENGNYVITSVQPGTYTVTAKQNGYTDTTASVDVIADRTAVAGTINLSSVYGSVSGKVALADSADNSGVTVTLTFIADSTIAPTAVSGADGTYTFSNLTNAGQYSVTFSKDGYVSSTGTVVTVTLGQNQTIDDVTLKSLASKVSGSATLAETHDYTGISVLLKATDNSVQYDATTDQQGSYVMARVKPGEYTLTVSKAGYVSKTVSDIIVESSTEKTLDSVSLLVGSRSITGSITAELKTDYSGFLVTATNLADEHKVYSAITNSSGAYTLAEMVPGEYQIVVSHTGYRTLTLPTVNVVEGTTKTIEAVEIEINRGTISGVATLEGRTSSEGILIELLQGNNVVQSKNTNSAGEYSFYVPQGNYSGVRMTMTNFRTETVSESIALFADNYISIDNTELKATANSVYGRADVLTTDDDSAVTVSFDGYDEITAIVTEADGAFRFDHLPIGNYSLRFQRENCSDIIVPVSVIASDGIDLNTVSITPNTATIKGKVNLENGSSLSGVLVTVDMGTKTATGYTDASGRYEIGGISVADVYTVTYSKDGWQSDSQQISPKLERLEIREMDEITLIDTTAPVLNSVVINSGANTAANKNVILHFNASEYGSGIYKVMITYDNVFDKTVTRYNYRSSIEWELPSGNGEKTIYVKLVDVSGNESNTVTATVTLTDQKKEVSGVLADDDLHWTEALSPYLVTGNIMVEAGKTLIIDAGVDVQFAGAYYIQTEGVISAIGTEEKKISFYGIDEGENNWCGIISLKENGSIIDHASILGMRNGIQGYLKIWNSFISASDCALGTYTYFDDYYRTTVSEESSAFLGELRDCVLEGNTYVVNCSLMNCTLSVPDAYIETSLISGCRVCGIRQMVKYCLVENSLFSNTDVYSSYSGMINTTFDSCNAWLGNGGLHLLCSFNNCDFHTGYTWGQTWSTESFSPGIIRKSNIVNCSGFILSTKRTKYEEFDYRENFWGYDGNREQEEKGINANLSFINDYYDDFSKSKANVTTYSSEPFDLAGYLGDSYFGQFEEAVSGYEIGDVGPAGGIVFYDKGYYSDGWRYLEAAPEDIRIEEKSSFVFGYYRATDESEYLKIGTVSKIGSGKINTQMLVEAMKDSAYVTINKDEDGVRTSEYAAKLCYDYELNGYDDWFLPSIEELNLMYINLHKSGLGGFSNDSYWSSTEQDYYAINALVKYFATDEYCYNDNKYTYCYVRPARAF